jgi:hypothetical protein
MPYSIIIFVAISVVGFLLAAMPVGVEFGEFRSE